MGTIRKTISAAVLLAAVFMFYSAAGAMDGLPPGTDEALEELQATMYPPWVHSVTVEPENPGPEDEITFTAEIYNDASVTRDETVEAYLMYSTDLGDTWKKEEMDEEKDNMVWSITLDPLPPGTEIMYGFAARDSSGNIMTETPCIVTTWPPLDDPCVFDLAVDEPPVDDEYTIVPDDFDIRGFRGGVDDENLYLEIRVEGGISPGSISPIYVHLYGFGVANMDKGDPTNIVSQGFLGVYAQNAASFAYLPCMTIFERGGEAVFDDSLVSCFRQAGGSSVWFRINNRQIGPMPSGHLKIIAATGAITSITPLEGVPYDYTHVTSVSLQERWLYVEGGRGDRGKWHEKDGR